MNWKIYNYQIKKILLKSSCVAGEMAGHHTSEANPGSFNPYLEGMSYPGQYGLYPHHFSKLRGPHDLNYGDYPTKPQQAVPTYKWMQVKRNVPKPGEFPN